MSKISMLDGINALWTVSEMPSLAILEGLYKSEFCSTSDCDGLVQSRRCADQMMRNRNFRIRSDVVEWGSVTKSHKGNKACVERKVGECFQWKAHGQCSKGDSCSFSHDSFSPMETRFERISCDIEGVYTIGLWKICSTWTWKIVIETHRRILQRHIAPNQNSGKKGSISRYYPKVCASWA